MIAVQCPNCQAMFRMDAQHAGRSMTCKRCESEFHAVAYQSPAASPAPRQPAAAPPPRRPAAPPAPAAIPLPPPLPDPRLAPFSPAILAAVQARVQREKGRKTKGGGLTVPRAALWSVLSLALVAAIVLRYNRDRQEKPDRPQVSVRDPQMPPLPTSPLYIPPAAADVPEAVLITLEEVSRGKGARLLVAVSDFELTVRSVVIEANPHRPGQWQRVLIPLRIVRSTRRINGARAQRVTGAILVSTSVRTEADLENLARADVIIGSVVGQASSLEEDKLNQLSRLNLMPIDQLRQVPLINHDDLTMPDVSSRPETK